MSFISLDFLFFVLATLFLYYLPRLRTAQMSILVIASLIFYGWDQWRLIPLLALTVIITYYALIGAIASNKFWAVAGIAANLSILAFFKYKFLFFSNIAFVHTSSTLIDYILHLPLPIGISFFVFHNISLIVDYYKFGKERDRPSFLQVTLYIIFFPQLVSGPITRAASFIPQIEEKYFKDIPWAQAVRFVITGLFFKLFCANNLAQITARMAPELSSSFAGGDKFFLLITYSFQIYADFFGYSMIALGLALLFGYRLPVNFRLPYTARSFSDFWTRWHISLSTWLKQYLYIPLGGNRISPTRTYLNLIIVMVLGGLWHGAAMSYAVWGLAHGALLAFERLGVNLLQKYAPRYRPQKFLRYLYCLCIFLCVSMCWLLFRFQEFSQAKSYFLDMMKAPFHFNQFFGWYGLCFIYMCPVIIQHALGSGKMIALKNGVASGFFYGGLLWFALAERGANTPFIYFRF